LRYANLVTDGDLILAARRVAGRLLEADEKLAAPRHDALRQRLERRYERGLELFRVG
jgi:hypothetical protein